MITLTEGVAEQMIDLLSDNPGCKEASIIFSIRSDNLAPCELTQTLGIEPTHCFAKGDQYSTHSGIAVRPWGIWSVETGKLIVSSSMEKHAITLLEKIEPARKMIQPYLDDPVCYVSCRFWWEMFSSHGGFDLSSSSISRLSRLCNLLNFTYIGGEQNGRSKSLSK